MKKKPSQENALSPDLESRIGKIRRLMTQEAAGNKHAYAIGVEVNDVRADPKKYGKGAVKAMAREVGCTEALLYSHATVADAWPPKDFTELASKTTAKGVPLTFSHFIELAKAAPNSRGPLLQRALSECLSVRALARLTSPAKRSRKPTPPKSADAVIHRVATRADAALNIFLSEKDLIGELLAPDSDAAPNAQLVREATVPLRKLAVVAGLICALLERRPRNERLSEGSSVPLLTPASGTAAEIHAAE